MISLTKKKRANDAEEGDLSCNQQQRSSDSSKRRSRKNTPFNAPNILFFVCFLFVCATMISFQSKEEDRVAAWRSVNTNSSEKQLSSSRGGETSSSYDAQQEFKADFKSSAQTVMNNGNDSSQLKLKILLQDELAYQNITAWSGALFKSLENQIMLTRNARSKIHQWIDIPLDASIKRKKVLFYMGWCAFYNMEDLALQGGPAGEFVIWADLATGLAALGYELTFVDSICTFWQIMKNDINGTLFDIVITDYDGLGTAENIGHFPKHHCKYYIVDGFGTQAKFNKRNFDLKRILTPYPFDGSNTPINLVTGVLPKPLWSDKRENFGILWAKLPKYLIPRGDKNKRLLKTIQKISSMVKLKSTLLLKKSELKTIGLGENVTVLGHQNRSAFLKLMTSSKFLLGIGMPVDGPTALEAIAHGCPFINPVFNPPMLQGGKPTRFGYTSQHPFIEANFGPPHAYTIDIYDPVVVAETIQTIMNMPPPKPFVHPFNSPREYLQNIKGIFDKQECDTKNPPKHHPNNRVYETYTHFIAAECSHRKCPTSVRKPSSCMAEMLDRHLLTQLKNGAKGK